MEMKIENFVPFNLVKRFTGDSHYWLITGKSDPFLFTTAVFHWDLGASRYHNSEIVFSLLTSDIKEHGKMASAGKPQDGKKDDNFKGFINVDLTENDKAVVKASWEKAKFPTLFSTLVDIGKVSISYNAQTNSYNCAVVFYNEPVKGFCVSSFAKNPLMALFITWYKLDTYADSITPDAAAVNRADFG